MAHIRVCYQRKTVANLTILGKLAGVNDCKDTLIDKTAHETDHSAVSRAGLSVHKSLRIIESALIHKVFEYLIIVIKESVKVNECQTVVLQIELVAGIREQTLDGCEGISFHITGSRINLCIAEVLTRISSRLDGIITIISVVTVIVKRNQFCIDVIKIVMCKSRIPLSISFRLLNEEFLTITVISLYNKNILCSRNKITLLQRKSCTIHQIKIRLGELRASDLIEKRLLVLFPLILLVDGCVKTLDIPTVDIKFK